MKKKSLITVSLLVALAAAGTASGLTMALVGSDTNKVSEAVVLVPAEQESSSVGQAKSTPTGLVGLESDSQIDELLSENVGEPFAQLGVSRIVIQDANLATGAFLMEVEMGTDIFKYGAVIPDIRPLTLEVSQFGAVRATFDPEVPLGSPQSYLQLAKSVSLESIRAVKRYVKGKERIL